MGVYGLEKFVEKRGLYKDFQVKSGSQVVIDGSALLRVLNTKVATRLPNSIKFGGEYKAYYETCNHFFQNMITCGIKMLILFDGAWVDFKFDHIKRRHGEKLKRFENVAAGGNDQDSAHLLPIFAMKCFTDAIADAMSKVGDYGMIECKTASFEADPEVAKEANSRCCPALTDDSDMMIYNVTEGYVKLTTLQWEDIKTDNKGRMYMNCKRVMSEDVAKTLGIPVGRLPLFAALRRTIDFRNYEYGPNTNNIPRVFSWIGRFLQRYPRDETDETVMNNVRLEQRQMQKMQKICMSYRLQRNEANSEEHLDVPDRIRTLLVSEQMGMYHGVLVVWQQGLFIPAKLVEDFSKPSSKDISRNLRCIWYSIICAGKWPHVTELSRASGTTNAVDDSVELKTEVTLSDGTKIKLTHLDDLDANEKRKLLLHTLECEDEEPVPDLSEELDDPTMEIPARVTTFWRKKTNPDDHIQRALLDFLTRPDEEEEEDQTPPPFNLNMAHAYAQWQGCLLTAYDLNIILGCPLPDFKIYPLLGNGSALHRMLNR